MAEEGLGAPNHDRIIFGSRQIGRSRWKLMSHWQLRQWCMTSPLVAGDGVEVWVGVVNELDSLWLLGCLWELGVLTRLHDWDLGLYSINLDDLD